MALQTPRQRSALHRPSFGNTNTASSPNLGASASAAMSVNRKASLRALTGLPPDPKSPGRLDTAELEVGDVVNVPGDMHGTVRFIGTVRGKTGKFVGVELAKEFAARGKNDGDVDGFNYFATTVPGSGIFLPVHRAEKRNSPTFDTFPPTPGTPSHSTLHGRTRDDSFTPPTPAVPLKFSQSVGPGAKPASPTFRPPRPSLPRPDSPSRRQAPTTTPLPTRTLSQTQKGARTALSATTPSKNNLRASTNTRPSTSHGPSTQSYSRANSRAGNRNDGNHDDDRGNVGLATSINNRNSSASTSVPSFSQPLRPSSRLGSAGGQESEVLRLRSELAERDKRLSEQAASLADMEVSVRELSGLLPPDGSHESSRKISLADGDDLTTAQLRQLLREKNDKITLLTSEFDAHRADFRSTLDSLEMASTETERVYEEQKRDLLAQAQEMTERLQEYEELNSSKKDFEDVARQLKGLEEFVQELEEGLEDARRGEAEARGEVEFLRGEVERGRSELKREREKAAAAVNGGGASARDLEQKDDEIRGLKAIIHSFTTGGATGASDARPVGLGEDKEEISRLQAVLSESQREKEKLEHELEQFRRDSAMTNGHGSSSHYRNESELTATGLTTAATTNAATTTSGANARPRADTVKATYSEHARRAGDRNAPPMPSSARTTLNGNSVSKSAPLYCDMCESRDHDTLDCTQFQTSHDLSTDDDDEDTTGGGVDSSDHATSTPTAMHQHVRNPSAVPAALHFHSLGKENHLANGTAANKPQALTQQQPQQQEDKWCALCEKDGHLAYECTDDNY